MSVRNYCERIARAGNVGAPKLELGRKWAVRGAKLMEGICFALGTEPPVDAVSVEMGSYHWACDATKAKVELGFQARDPQTTVTDTVHFLEKKGLFRRPS